MAKPELSLTIVLGTVYFLIPYNLLRYGVDDLFDTESVEAPASRRKAVVNPVISQAKQPALWRWIVISNLPFLIYFLVIGNLESIVFLIMMLYMVFAYSAPGLRYKEIPFIDSLTSAFQLTAPFILGLLLYFSPDLWAPIFAAGYFWAVGNHAFAALQDLQGKSTERRSIAAYLGPAKTLAFCLFAYALAIIAPLLGFGLKGLIALVVVSPYLLAVLAAYFRRNNFDPQRIRRTWRRFVLMNNVLVLAGAAILLYLYNK